MNCIRFAALLSALVVAGPTVAQDFEISRGRSRPHEHSGRGIPAPP